jgi:hypothetical protein
MGSSLSRPFVRNDKIDGQGKQFLLFAKRINLQKYEVNRLFYEFSKYSNPETQQIEVNVLLQNASNGGTFKSHLPFSLVGSLILQIFDRNKFGVLNFMEYVIAMWCFLSTDEDEMARMCFGLFDIYK